MEVESPSMVKEIVEKEKLCLVVNTSDLGSYPPLPTQETTSAGNASGLFSFQFSSMEGLNAMLENGFWFIHNNPLILKKWHLNVNLLEEAVGTVLVWVKLYGVPVTAFSEDGLSVIATKLGYYTCNIHVEYEWKPPRCAYFKVFGHVQEEFSRVQDSHELDDYGYDPYDDDMYEGQEIPEMLQTFCNNLDIKVRGRKKK
nr:hypothetical protein [Tanacetum cinerariifolium]